MRTSTKSRERAQAPERTPAPKADAPNALSVSEGTVTAGFIAERNGAHFAFGADQKLIGRFPTRAAAIAALPRAS